MNQKIDTGTQELGGSARQAGRRPAARARWTLALLAGFLGCAPAVWLAPRTAVSDEAVHRVLSAAGRGLVPSALAPWWMAAGRAVWLLAPAHAPYLLALFSAVCSALTCAFVALIFLDLPQDRLAWQRTRRLPRAVRYWWPALVAGVLVGWSPAVLAQALAPQSETMGSALTALAAWLLLRTYRRHQEIWQDAIPALRPPAFAPSFLVLIGFLLGGAATFGGLISLAAAVLLLLAAALDPRMLWSPRRVGACCLGLVLGLGALAAQAWALSRGENPSLGGPESFAAALLSVAGALIRSVIPRGVRFGPVFFLVLFAAIPATMMAIRVERRGDAAARIRTAAILAIFPLAIPMAALNVLQPRNPFDPVRGPFPGAPPDAIPIVAWSALSLVWLIMALFVGALGQPVRDGQRALPQSRDRRAPAIVGMTLLAVLTLAGAGWSGHEVRQSSMRLAGSAEHFEAALEASVRGMLSGSTEPATVVADGSALDGRLRLALRGVPATGLRWINVATIERNARRTFAAGAERNQNVITTVARRLAEAEVSGSVILLHPDLCAPMPGACATPFGLLHRLDAACGTADAREWAERQERFAADWVADDRIGGNIAGLPVAALRWSRFANELGLLHAVVDAPDRAARWFREAADLMPSNVAAWGNLALSQAGAGDAAEFASSLDAAKRHALHLRERAGREITYLAVHRSMGDVAAPVWFIAAASQTMARGYAEGAAYMATLGCALFPDSYRLALLAGGLRILVDGERAPAEIAGLRDRFPDEPMAEVGIGLLWWMAGEREAATAALESAAAAMPEVPGTRVLLSRLRESRGDLRGALEEIQAAARMGFDSPDAARRESQILLAMGEEDAALETIRGALEAFPDDARLLVALAQIQIARGRMPEALASLDAAHAIDPRLPGLRSQHILLKTGFASDPETEREARELADDPVEGWAGHIALARAAQNRGDIPLALRHYRESSARSESFVALNNLAVLLAAPGAHQDLAEALRLSARALELAPNHAAVLDTRGWILLRAGEVEEAAPLLERAWAAVAEAAGPAASDRASVTLHLAALRLKQGRDDEARDLIAGMQRSDLPPEDRPYLDRLRDELATAR